MLACQNPPCNSMPYPSSWPQVGSMLAHVGSMLAHVGSSGLQDGSTWLQVDPSWPQDAIMLAQVGLSPKWLSIAKLHQIVTKTCSFWNAWDLQNIEKPICFICPFASCTFLFLLMLFGLLGWLKLAPSWLRLADLNKIELKLSQVGSKLAQVGSKLGPSWLHVDSSWAHVGAKLAPN